MGLFQKKHHGPNGPKLLALLALDWQLISLGTATHFCRSTWSTFIFGVSLRLGSKVFGPKKLGEGLNLDIFCYAAWQAALLFYGGMIRNDLCLFSMKWEWKSKKQTPCRKYTRCFTLLFLPNALENLKWKLLKWSPTFLTNHPPRNNHVSHLGKSKIIFKSTLLGDYVILPRIPLLQVFWIKKILGIPGKPPHEITHASPFSTSCCCFFLLLPSNIAAVTVSGWGWTWELGNSQ